MFELENTNDVFNFAIPFVEVLIPHKNQPHKLARLLKSIPSEVGVIVIDDNSEDEVLRVCNDYINANYTNVRLVKNTSTASNAGTARNIALDESSAEWLIFADSDDLFYSEKLSNLLKFLEETESNLVFFNVDAIYELDGTVSERAARYSNLINDWPNNRETIAFEWVVPWGKAIRRRILFEPARIRFASRVVSNDIEFSTELALTKPSIDVYNEVVYRCYQSKDSLTGSLSPEKAHIRLEASAMRNRKLFLNRVKVHYNYDVRLFRSALPMLFKKGSLHLIYLFMSNFLLAMIGNFFINDKSSK